MSQTGPRTPGDIAPVLRRAVIRFGNLGLSACLAVDPRN
jgi:hypothetical protein